ncbi:MAG: endo-1,4-beta-xylanase [Spirochaetaceae bacterium]|nr:endo-1,4-beta-xylanase [Spirochaetaceae bacterium]
MKKTLVLIFSLGLVSILLSSCAKKTLKDYAAKHGVKTGVAVAVSDLNNEEHLQIIRENSSIVVAENCMKWESVHPGKTTWNWNEVDRMIEFAEKNKIEVKWHTLFWHNQNPRFLSSLETREQALEVMDEHITTIMTRYKGRISEYDVVNEMFNEDGTMRETIWYKTIGPDYIEHALIKARETDPNAKLFLNEYNNEEQGNKKADAMYEMVKDFVKRGIPIDGVGFQLHLATIYPYNAVAVKSNIRRYADLGLEVSFSEVDVRMLVPPSENSLKTQTKIYSSLAKLAKEEPNVTSFITWGFTDKQSWVPYTFTGYGDALLYNRDLKKKPVYEAVLKEFEKK